MAPGLLERFRRAARAFTGPDWDKVPADLDRIPSGAGVAVSPSLALGLPGVLCAVRTVSETLAMLPLLVYRRRQDGGKERARDHAAYQVLRRQANRYQTAFEFKSLLQCWVMLWGNGYAEVLRNRAGDVIELLPLHPLTVTLDTDGDRVIYRHRRLSGGGERVLGADRVFHLAGFSSEGLLGLSPVKMCKDALGVALALEVFAGVFFAMVPGWGAWFRFPRERLPSDEEFERTKNDVREAHKGARNSHGVLFLDGGLQFTQTTVSPEDSQALESRVFSVQDVARIFGIPPHLLMDLSSSIKSNIFEQSLQFKAALLPLGERWSQRADMTILGGDPDYFTGWVWDGLIQSDTKSRFEAYAIARVNGWLNADEIRERENLNPLPDGAGQEYLKQLNMGTAGALPAAPVA